MVHTDLCSKCNGPLSFRPRVDVSLNLNDPSTRSSLSMREIIPLCTEDLDDYDAEIARLQSQLIHVQAQRKRLADYKTQIHFLLSPFRQFPNEVLSIIFEYTCTDNLLQEYPWPFKEQDPPTPLSSPVITYLPTLAISTVCKRWRSLVLVSPTLWSQIRLEISLYDPSKDHDYFEDSDDLYRPPDDGFMRTIQLYLDRSANAPLAISVETGGYNYKNPHALRLLLNHDHRWKFFQYSGTYDPGKWQRYNPSFPILESLMVGSFWGRPFEDYTCFKDAPNLRSVITEGRIYDLPLAWNRLTYLDIRLPKDEDMTVLHRFPALTTLRLRRKGAVIGASVTSLDKLESFIFVNSRHHSTTLVLNSIFSCFTFSSLKRLIIDSEFTTPQCTIRKLIWPPSAFSAFISRSTCMLTKLSLTDVEISDLNLIAALCLLPSLVEFEVDGLVDSDGGSSITARFISSMHALSTPPLLPRLRSLSMDIHTTAFEDAAFVDMVSSRWSPIVSSQAAIIEIDCLRSVELYFSNRMVDKAVYEALWQLDKMGMSVVIIDEE